MQFLQRLAKTISFIRGDYIVLMPEGDKLTVDCGLHTDKVFVKNVAALFLKTAFLANR